MPVVTVAVEPPYDVTIGPDVLGLVSSLVEGRNRVFVVSQAKARNALSRNIAENQLDALGALAVIGDGEEAKTLATVEWLCSEFSQEHLTRGDVVVALGGGVVGDTAGFAAAVYHRGVDVLQVPTTLLAQVDASVGGKTAVNLPEGKNLVGAFHQPIAVVADTSTLTTLPDVEYRSGLGEVAKYALMPQGERIASLLESSIERVKGRDPEVLSELVTRCVEIKAEVVAADPEERTGLRAMLNLGHTLAHALETTSHHTLAHGEAVSIGLAFAMTLASQLERVAPDVPERTMSLLRSLGLPTQVPGAAPSADELVSVMTRDKKSKGGITFVLPGANGLETVDDPPMKAINAALRSVGVEA